MTVMPTVCLSKQAVCSGCCQVRPADAAATHPGAVSSVSRLFIFFFGVSRLFFFFWRKSRVEKKN